MNPILVFQHIACEGPGYLGEFLSGKGIPFRLVCIDRGEAVPESPEGAAGLVFMGGPMSVNDPLPWVDQERTLIRAAHVRGVPMLGHCLGAQLIASALGGVVRPNPVREIGWWPVEVLGGGDDGAWTAGLGPRIEVFHWHGETFSIPPGGTHLARSRHCENQAFALGSTLGLQFHVEVTAPMVEEWLNLYRDDLTDSPAVQRPAAIRDRIEARVSALRSAADLFYARWVEGLAP